MTAHPNSISGWRSQLDLLRCSKCGQHRYPTPGAHQERWEERGSVMVLVDCRGDVVRTVAQ